MILLADRISIHVDEGVVLATTAVHRHEDGNDQRAAELLRQAIRRLEEAEQLAAKRARRKR